MDAQIVDYLFKGIISLTIGLGLFLLKEFKVNFKSLSDSLNQTNLSLQTLITKDTHRETIITELKEQITIHTKEIGVVRIRLALIEQKQKE